MPAEQSPGDCAHGQASEAGAERAPGPRPHAGDAESWPPWFRPDRIIRPIFVDSASAFVDMQMLETDVVLSSFPKTGTTWIHGILYCLLRMDGDGRFLHDVESDVGASGQIYADAIPMEPPAQPRKRFGSASFRSLTQQPSPRLFSTHMRDGMLPRELTARGKLVYMLRNPKDTLTSLHFFLQRVAELSPKELPKALVKEGWLGDGDGRTGTYHRFNAWPEEENSWWCGSYYGHVLGMSAVVKSLGERATVVYYERLHEDLEAELWRLGRFLGVPMTPAKVSAVVGYVSKDSMKGRLQREGKGALLRHGVVGDHQQYLTREHWEQMDTWFAERLRGIGIIEPLLRYMV